MKKHNLAIVGFGGMAGWHYDLIEKLENLSVSGIWDIKEERREYARSRQIPVYESLEDLLADETVDLVLVATPNDVHKSIAIAAMAAGKNVVSEKPVTLCSEDLQEMIKASETYGKFLTVHQNRRWDEDFLTVKKLMDEWNEIETLRVENDKNREEVYKEALRSCDSRQWVRLIKTSYQRNQIRIEKGKKATTSDERYLQMAEENLFGELAIPLEMSRGEAEAYFVAKVRKNAKEAVTV